MSIGTYLLTRKVVSQQLKDKDKEIARLQREIKCKNKTIKRQSKKISQYKEDVEQLIEKLAEPVECDKCHQVNYSYGGTD